LAVLQEFLALDGEHRAAADSVSLVRAFQMTLNIASFLAIGEPSYRL
jgi:hypothetical protein